MAKTTFIMINELIEKYSKVDYENLKVVFTHSSFINENQNDNNISSNERLEYLGDSVISYIVSIYLYSEYPTLPEGDLSKIRSEIVNQNSLAEVARELKFGKYLILGKGEEKNNGRDKNSNLCNLFEAIIGYFSIKIGLEETSKLFINIFKDKINFLISEKAYFDPKSLLQEKLQDQNIDLPIYKSIKNKNGQFKVSLYIKNTLYAEAVGKRKIDAEKEAAKIALEKL